MGVFTRWIMENRSYIDAWSKHIKKTWGVNTDMAYKGAILFILSYLYGLKPQITSGYRSTEKQAELYNRWLAGDTTIHTPAKPGTSPHERRIAMDMWCTNAQTAAYIAHQIGLKTGIEFDDPVHFST